MSLVGTRPPTLDEWEKYEPHHRARMSFRPGLTGLWQVSGRSNITDFEEVVKLDTQYIGEWSVKWNFLEAFSVSDDYKTEPIDFYFEFKKSSTCSLAELVKKEHRYICNDGYIKEHSIDDLSECIVVHNRKQALKIFANINRIFDDYLSKAGLEGRLLLKQIVQIVRVMD